MEVTWHRRVSLILTFAVLLAATGLGCPQKPKASIGHVYFVDERASLAYGNLGNFHYEPFSSASSVLSSAAIASNVDHVAYAREGDAAFALVSVTGRLELFELATAATQVVDADFSALRGYVNIQFEGCGPGGYTRTITLVAKDPSTETSGLFRFVPSKGLEFVSRHPEPGLHNIVLDDVLWTTSYADVSGSYGGAYGTAHELVARPIADEALGAIATSKVIGPVNCVATTEKPWPAIIVGAYGGLWLGHQHAGEPVIEQISLPGEEIRAITHVSYFADCTRAFACGFINGAAVGFIVDMRTKKVTPYDVHKLTKQVIVTEFGQVVSILNDGTVHVNASVD